MNKEVKLKTIRNVKVSDACYTALQHLRIDMGMIPVDEAASHMLEKSMMKKTITRSEFVDEK